MEKFEALKAAVEALYYSAHWFPDRNVDAKGLWTAVRDAAELEPGRSVKILGAPRNTAYLSKHELAVFFPPSANGPTTD